MNYLNRTRLILLVKNNELNVNCQKHDKRYTYTYFGLIYKIQSHGEPFVQKMFGFWLFLFPFILYMSYGSL